MTGDAEPDDLRCEIHRLRVERAELMMLVVVVPAGLALVLPMVTLELDARQTATPCSCYPRFSRRSVWAG